MQQRGAAQVVGVDISPEIVRLARAKDAEVAATHGLTPLVGRAQEVGLLSANARQPMTSLHQARAGSPRGLAPPICKRPGRSIGGMNAVIL